MRRVVCWRKGDERLLPLATFRLEDDMLEVEWHVERYRRAIERDGLIVPSPEGLITVHLASGAAFFDALTVAHERDSRIEILTRP